MCVRYGVFYNSSLPGLLHVTFKRPPLTFHVCSTRGKMGWPCTSGDDAASGLPLSVASQSGRSIDSKTGSARIEDNTARHAGSREVQILLH